MSEWLEEGAEVFAARRLVRTGLSLSERLAKRDRKQTEADEMLRRAEVWMHTSERVT